MVGNSVIFSHGMESDFLAFNSGMCARVNVAEKPGRLVVYLTLPHECYYQLFSPIPQKGHPDKGLFSLDKPT